eukprot:GHVL01009203.1.p1 GENE.GHVL01009203.1~~GHVL01009203.1.p1  ORF type:complete len:594 (-),score=72.10 GHVL01009203.1:253-2034(-)
MQVLQMDSDEEASRCPLCLEDLYPTDRGFYPCPCGYKVCLWCVHRIMERFNGLCPACREVYSKDNFRQDDHPTRSTESTDEIAHDPNSNDVNPHMVPMPEANIKNKPNSIQNASYSSSSSYDAMISRRSALPPPTQENERVSPPPNASKLAHIRVIQRNLLYLIGLPSSIAKSEILKKPEYFGQYGKILKVSVNRNPVYNAGATGAPSFSAYLTFEKNCDAALAIRAVDGFLMESKCLRASFGTTKYCASYLRGNICTAIGCLYLHSPGKQSDSFTKEAMVDAKHQFLDLTTPSRYFANWDDPREIPSFLLDEADPMHPPKAFNPVIPSPETVYKEVLDKWSRQPRKSTKVKERRNKKINENSNKGNQEHSKWTNNQEKASIYQSQNLYYSAASCSAKRPTRFLKKQYVAKRRDDPPFSSSINTVEENINSSSKSLECCATLCNLPQLPVHRANAPTTLRIGEMKEFRRSSSSIHLQVPTSHTNHERIEFSSLRSFKADIHSHTCCGEANAYSLNNRSGEISVIEPTCRRDSDNIIFDPFGEGSQPRLRPLCVDALAEPDDPVLDEGSYGWTRGCGSVSYDTSLRYKLFRSKF